MAELFRSARGTVIVETVSGPQYMTVSGPGLDILGSSVLSAVRVSRKESVHHIKTLSNTVFSYAFGEFPGSASVTGILLLGNTCGARQSSLGRANSSYERNRAYVAGKTAYLGIGGASFKVALTSLDLAADAGPFPMGQFTMGFAIIPNESQGGSS